MDLNKVANDIEGLFQCIGVLVGIVILAAIIAAIVFGGTTTFFGSMMGAALNRTIAEREYLEQADKQGQPVSAYHSEEDNAKFEQSTARGCSFQIMAALVGGAMLWIMYGVFMERNFGEEEFWACVAISGFTAFVVYSIRQSRRELLLPEELASQGRVPLYLTWLYICMFINVVLAGVFGVWGLSVPILIAIAVLIHHSRHQDASTDTVSESANGLEDDEPEQVETGESQTADYNC